MTSLELCFLQTVSSKPVFAGDGQSTDGKRDFSLRAVCLSAEIRTKNESSSSGGAFCLQVVCFRCGFLLPQGCCHTMAVQCHVELELVLTLILDGWIEICCY